ncbi:hypothetical protein JX266_001113 [Neoarthrinium moseri]|nr:hypothetical protein JX266_001113 [Neoarthrinium moseri]
MYGTFRQSRFTYGHVVAEDELRLLRPLPSRSDSPSFLVLKVRRSAAPKYTAVSYTWGDEQPSRFVYLDGKQFPVRRNLWSLLHYLSPVALAQDRHWDYLWVDAICINQDDDSERAAQVSRMDQTYRDATCVSVWLGLPSIPSDLFTLHPSSEPINTLEVDMYDWEDSMEDLANRPYWSRFWVIQEFLLGQDVELYCSNTRMNWADFKDILCRVAGVDQYGDSPYSTENTGSRAFGAFPLVMGRHIDKHPEYLQPLHDLIIDHRHSKCKEPRDRVFALIGLTTQDEQGLLRRVFPDYRMPEDHVLVYTLAHVMQYGPLIAIQREQGSITVKSDDLFQGLGVTGDYQRRKKLLRQAKALDYLSGESAEELQYMLALHDDDFYPYDEDDNVEPAANKGWARGKFARGVVLMIIVVIAISLWVRNG